MSAVVAFGLWRSQSKLSLSHEAQIHCNANLSWSRQLGRLQEVAQIQTVGVAVYFPGIEIASSTRARSQTLLLLPACPHPKMSLSHPPYPPSNLWPSDFCTLCATVEFGSDFLRLVHLCVPVQLSPEEAQSCFMSLCCPPGLVQGCWFGCILDCTLCSLCRSLLNPGQKRYWEDKNWKVLHPLRNAVYIQSLPIFRLSLWGICKESLMRPTCPTPNSNQHLKHGPPYSLLLTE